MMNRLTMWMLAVACGVFLSACSKPQVPSTVRIEFKGTQGVKVEGYWVAGGMNPINTTVPSTIMRLAGPVEFLKVRKACKDGTLLVSMTDSRGTVFHKELTNAFEEVTYGTEPAGKGRP